MRHYDRYKAIEAKTINQEIQAGTLRGTIDATDLDPWLKNVQSIEQVVDLFFRIDFFQLKDHQETPQYNGEQLVRRAIVTGFLKTLFKLDQERAPFELIGLELEVSDELHIQTGKHREINQNTTAQSPSVNPSSNNDDYNTQTAEQESITIRIGGTIDRLDRKDGVQRILDYKTGGYPKNPANVESLFANDVERANYVFQIFLYAAILQKSHPETVFCPELYNLLNR